MKLTHHTSKPFKLDRSVKYSIYSEAPGKPNGLWVSVDNDWKRWCISEDYGKSELAHKCTITLKKKAKILYINYVNSMKLLVVLINIAILIGQRQKNNIKVLSLHHMCGNAD